jgi:hypothetical protein
MHLYCCPAGALYCLAFLRGSAGPQSEACPISWSLTDGLCHLMCMTCQAPAHCCCRVALLQPAHQRLLLQRLLLMWTAPLLAPHHHYAEMSPQMKALLPLLLALSMLLVCPPLHYLFYLSVLVQAAAQGQRELQRPTALLPCCCSLSSVTVMTVVMWKVAHWELLCPSRPWLYLRLCLYCWCHCRYEGVLLGWAGLGTGPQVLPSLPAGCGGSSRPLQRP